MEARSGCLRHWLRSQGDTNGRCDYHDEVKQYHKCNSGNLHDECQKDYTGEDAFEAELKVGVSSDKQNRRYRERHCQKI